MNGLVKSSLATALALATSQAFALGLGPIQVRSGLNQPLVAEIPVLADSAAEANELRVELASAEDFQRVGLSRGRVGVPIEFSVGSNGRGQTVIKLTTKEIVREPFLDFLIEVNWSKGKLLREYTVLLDPPITAPAVVNTAKPAAVAPAVMQSRPAPGTAAETSKMPVAASAASPTPAPRSTPAPRAESGGEYGPVRSGQVLSNIARGLDVSTGANLNQVMLALLKANPNAFYRDNVNTLKTGAVLRIPSADEIAAAGSLREAALAVRAQNQSWAAAAKPTQVNQVGTPSAPQASTPDKAVQATKADHLTLVPAGKGNEGGGGTSSGSAKDADARAELSRTKETLANRDQEAGELKSRVKQLEDINDKGQHLISLKDSEIADLQNKLKDLQATKAASASAPAKPAETPVAVAKLAEIAPPPVETPAKPVEVPAHPAETSAKAADIAATPAEAPKPVETSTPPADATAKPADTTTTPKTDAAVTTPLKPDTTALVEAPATTPPATPPPASVSTPAKPVVPPSVGKPWYSDYLGDNPYALYGLGALFLLVGAWAASRLFGKPKASVRPAYRDLSSHDDAAHEASAENEPAVDEQHLVDHLAEHPDDTDASLELLRHYYVNGDAPRFEALAESLQHQLPEDSQQWAEVLAMGEDLAPHHPLFAAPAAHADDDMHAHSEAAHPHADADLQHFDFDEPETHAARAAAAVGEHDDHTHDERAHDERTHDDEHGHLASEFEAHDHSGTFEPAQADSGHMHDLAAGTASEHTTAATEFFTGEDTISTRLDLARAYLDMGDPEGARSMLDEVLAEGNAAQKEEARKLLAELH